MKRELIIKSVAALARLIYDFTTYGMTYQVEELNDGTFLVRVLGY